MKISSAVIENEFIGHRPAPRRARVAAPERLVGFAIRQRRCGAWLIAPFLIAAASGCVDLDAAGGELDRSEAALAAGWATAEIGGGFHPALALDSTGNPALSYARGVPDPARIDGDLTPVHASNDGTWRAGTGWRNADIAVNPGKVDGFANAIGFSPSATVAYTSRTRTDRDSGYVLLDARRVNNTWQVTTVEPTPWVHQVRGRVKGATTVLGYVSTAQPGVLLARSTSGGAWIRAGLPILPRDLLSSMDIAIGTGEGEKDELRIGAVTSTLLATSAPPGPRGVHFATTADGGNQWGAIVHVDSSAAMIGPQIAYAGSNPLLSYSDVGNKLAKLARSFDGGATWSVETVAGPFSSTPSTGLTVDLDGAPLLAIVAPDAATSHDHLYLARPNDKGGWSLELVDSVAWSLGLRLGVDPRIAVTADGSIVIAYDYGGAITRRVRVAWKSPL